MTIPKDTPTSNQPDPPASVSPLFYPDSTSSALTDPGTRFHGLDCVRAAAMLLGVFYHAIQSNMFTPDGLTSSMASAFVVMEFLHCFRMPLFFMVSGFFCAMMLHKYGLKKYLVKRLFRILIPMLIGVIVFGSIHATIKPPPPLGLGTLMDLWDEFSPYSETKPLPKELLPFDENRDGWLNHDEWKVVFAKRGNPDVELKNTSNDKALTEQPGPFEKDSFTDGSFDITPFLPRVGPMAKALFGSNGRYFTLGHLWFLWYLLIFAIIAPFFIRAIQALNPPIPLLQLEKTSRKILAWGIAPGVLALLSVLAMMQTRGLLGWSLGMAEGIFVSFPDVLFQFQWDMPFYFLYFLTGWWLYGFRDMLNFTGRYWHLYLGIGTVCFFVSLVLAGIFSRQTDHPHFALLRILGYSVSSMATATLGWGFLGFFQRYLDHPNRVILYLAQSAFWIYLVHQELLPPSIRMLAPLNLSFWPIVLLSTLLSTGISLVLYECFIRKTPLASIFGAVVSQKKQPH